MGAEDTFDLAAAGLRADGEDLRVWLEVLAGKLAEALPSGTTVRRSGGGLLGRGERHVTSLAVEVGATKFELSIERGRLLATRQREVGGVAIKRQQLEPQEWIAELTADLRSEAARSAEARAALERLLA